MNLKGIINKNIAYYARYYKLVTIAVIIMVTVITGSMMVGDSVRTTLVKRVTERLGNTETIIFSRNSFMRKELLDNSLLENTAKGILLTNGFISHNGELVPVYVWGVDHMSVSKGMAKINSALAKELGQNTAGDIVLRLPASGMVPSGSLFVTDNYTTSLRLAYEGIVEMKDGGNLSMKNEQVIPLNIFVNRDELAGTLALEGKINLILADKHISADDLNKIWNYTFSGLLIHQKNDVTEITTDRVFIQEEVIESITQNNREPNKLFSYLANTIETDSISIPYSFVTAMDRYKNEPLGRDEIILSDYAAKRLKVKEGDVIRTTYFTSHDLKTLVTDTIILKLKKIVPLNELLGDSTLSADFPGLSNVERCTDWDSDLPINMDLITQKDEKYWEDYRTTPKAIIPYNVVVNDWSNAYGNATAVRLTDQDPQLSELTPEMFGIQRIYPKEAGLYAAKNGVDFSSLFMALGFFIILSAMLLMLIPLSEMLYQRKHEITLLKSLGYSRKRITRLLWMESAPIVFVASVIGVIAGLLYTSIIMWLLGNVWKGATHTDGFSVYPGSGTIITGFLVGILLSLWLLYSTIARNLKEKPNNRKPKTPSLRKKKILAFTFSVLSLGIICANFFYFHNVVLFVIIGIMLITTAAIWGEYLICCKGSVKTNEFSHEKMIWSTLYANKKQAILSFFALTTGVFIVFSVGLNRKGFADSAQIKTGTGGYSLWCESSVPVYHNMNTQAGREKLSLTDLPANTTMLQCLRYSSDDASCLNLNKVSTPTVLGVDMEALATSDFQIQQSLYALDKSIGFKEMQINTGSGSVYPALVDATVLTWSLGMSLGDTLHYENDRGEKVNILLAGTLSNSIFQGHILVDRSIFSTIWPETTGSEVLLVKTDEPEKENVKTLISQALNEYGVSVTTTNNRLKQFNTVTDTYLTIFMTLGGLGLLLGIMSFIVVIRKNLSMRRWEINSYHTLGFKDNTIKQIFYKENILVPLYAIVTGVISSIVGVGVNFANTGIWVWLMAVLFTLFFIICVVIFVKQLVNREILNSKHSKV